ncbi:DUF2188 domain-containing protein [Cupriavidus sp. BIC8F]|uniref:DUF2188 domain-containing protein n=1 Tax=Cupriavidus sp. BIC8F TaxID=3079014 RepID=UPI0029163261|nr:DUF2188 domain-containing protein [Cupriavidus sp. BIC8F]
MATFPRPEYSRTQVKRAGATLIDETATKEDQEAAFVVLTNWRACHGYPVNTFQATLRTRLKRLGLNALVAQRLKRTPSILGKLQRNPSMDLSRMQDIGGLRAVLPDIKAVRALRDNYVAGTFTHELAGTDDYIAAPKASGYRGIHLVFKYNNPAVPEYNGLRVELQFRTTLQHAWATAVETIGTFLGQALKSSEGEDRWLDFFALTASAFAYLEASPLVPGYEHMDEESTFREVSERADHLEVRERLRAFAVAANKIATDNKPGNYHLIVLDSTQRTVTIKSFGKKRLDEANAAYAETERRIDSGESIQAVLVSAGNIDSLRKAYPNYFLDTKAFISLLDRIHRRAIEKAFPGIKFYRAPDVHVFPSGSGWLARASGFETKTFPTKSEAIDEGTSMALRMRTELLIHDTEGKLRERRSYAVIRESAEETSKNQKNKKA